MFGELIIPSLGLLFILKYGYILQKPRDFLKDSCNLMNEFLTCCMCMGFWVGLSVSFVYTLLLSELTLISVFNCIMFGFMISFIGFFSDVLLEVMDAIIDYCKKDKND